MTMTTMDGTRLQPSAGGDRLSKLEDGVLGHVLFFLPAKDAARAALLSSRWRGVFADVHTVALEEPESPLQDRDSSYDADSWYRGPLPDPNGPPPFSCAVSNALLARVLAPTNVTSDDARRRQFEVAVFHEPRMNPQVHGIPL